MNILRGVGGTRSSTDYFGMNGEESKVSEEFTCQGESNNMINRDVACQSSKLNPATRNINSEDFQEYLVQLCTKWTLNKAISFMRKLAILTFVTLDGVMQSPSGPEEDSSGGFTHGGWARKCWDDVMEQVMREAMAEPYDLLLGRKTYEIFAGHFLNAPKTPDSEANKMTNATKFVATSTLNELA